MGTRFILRVAPQDHDDAARLIAFKARISSVPDMEVIGDLGHVTVASQNGQHLKCGDRGIILGTLFRRGERSGVTALSYAEQTQIMASGGRFLFDACWGPYVACLLSSDGTVILLRAPWGDLPCYRFAGDGAEYFASDIDLLTSCAGYQPTIGWNAVVDHLVHGAFYDRATCLSGIEQCPGGERLTLAGDRELREDLWSPWTFAARDRQITCPKAAAELIKETALTCINARASQFEQVLVTLSGGLDSSIVAASLAAGQARFSAMTLVTRDAAGDERHHANRVSEALGCPLITTQRDATQVDISRSGARDLPYPCVLTFFAESMRLADEAATRLGAQAIFNGGGGDTVFCSIQSGAPAADRLLAEGFSRGFLRTLGDISDFAPASVPAVLRDAVARAWFGKPPYRHGMCVDLLTEAARQCVAAKPANPWLSAPASTLPGKAFHAYTLAYFKSYVESLDPCRSVPIVAPLLSQPLVEACLSIPSWLWFGSGLNRLVARQAFTGLLPPETLSRRSKGTPSSFGFEIFDTHRNVIRKMLVEGELAKQGLIDLPSVLAILDARHPASEDMVSRILDFIDVEAWAAGWSTSPR